jgi:hypothetical protein
VAHSSPNTNASAGEITSLTESIKLRIIIYAAMDRAGMMRFALALVNAASSLKGMLRTFAKALAMLGSSAGSLRCLLAQQGGMSGASVSSTME